MKSAHGHLARFVVAALACALAAGCGGGSSSDDDPASSSSTSTSTTTMPGATSTSTSSSTTSSTAPAATTTTTLGGQGSVPITFSMVDAATVGALQFDVDYSRAPGVFQGAGVDVECNGLISGILLSHNNEMGDEMLRIGMLSLDGFTGPIDLVRCTFVYDPMLPAPEDFDISIVDVAGPDLFPVVPEPVVAVSVEPAP